MTMFKRFLALPVAALALAGGVAQADRLALDRLDEILERAGDYGFVHYQEIEAEGRDRVDVEGWLDDEWHAEVRLSLRDGSVQRESRERRVSGAWGMNEDEVRRAFELAAAEGMVEFEEIKIGRTGLIEVEGYDGRGRELEIGVREGELAHVDRD